MKMKVNDAIFTPKDIAETMAHQALEYWQTINNKQMVKARILDPACGTGNLLEACKEYIEELYYFETPDITGIDIRKEFLQEAKKRIPEGKFYNFDALLEAEKLGKFDFVIANPPYVSVNCIEEEKRKLYKEKYKSYYGRADLYILFMELGWRLLKENGIMAFLVPPTWLKSVNGTGLRKLFKEEQAELYIVDIEGKIFKEQVFSQFVFAVKRKSKVIHYVIWSKENSRC